jgi:hypothetical protein
MPNRHNKANIRRSDEEGSGGQRLPVIDGPLRKTHDYTYHFTGCDGRGSSCHVEIHEGDGRPPLILCSAPPARGAPGYWPVEYLAAEVVRRHFPQAFEAIGEPFIWLERCPSEQGAAPAGYVWVTFDSYAPRCVEHACGTRHVALRQARRMVVGRAAVEELIGQAPLAGPPGSQHCADG